MLDQVEEITVTFKNGNQLILCLKESTFAGHKPALLWELFYAEKVFESPNWQNKGSDESHFDAIQTEYFPATNVHIAIEAFNKRLSSVDSTRVSGMGFSLDYLIEKKQQENNEIEKCSYCSVKSPIKDLSTKYSSSYKYLCSCCEHMVSGT